MVSDPKPKFERMTVERLREHLFGGPQVPFWNYDPNQLTIGIEVEYFIAHVHTDGSFTLATKDEYMKVVEYLVREHGFIDRQISDQPGRVSLDTERGFVAIKPDFAWHILEISFPPRENLDDLGQLVRTHLEFVDRALGSCGLQRLNISALPAAPNKVQLVELDRLARFTDSVNQVESDNPLMDPKFPAYIVATHVHLNASKPEVFDLLPHCFRIEKSFSNLFCRAKSFAGISVENLRTSFMDVTMGPDYKLKGIPTTVVNDIKAYVDQMNESKPAFPHDKFFPVRDVTYIRPTKYGTLEFRSACSVYSSEQICEIAGWRIVQMMASYQVQRNPSRNLKEILSSVRDELLRGRIINQRVLNLLFQKLTDYDRAMSDHP